jgi:hypothetical protein
MDNERRHYKRVHFDTTATLSKDEQSFACKVIDLSIHDVLLRPHGVIRSKVGSIYQLDIPLSDQQNHIGMSLKLTHQHPKKPGVHL